MGNPFRSEARAFRFVLVVAVAAAAGAVTAVWAPTAAAAAVSAFAAAVVAVYVVGRRRAGRIPAAPPHLGPATARRLLLVVDDDDRPDESDLAALRGRADSVLVVSLAATSPLRHWISDVDRARARAGERMEEVVSRLRDSGVDASGVVGDDDPFAAVDDALRTFGGDEIVVAGGGERLVASLRARYALPVSAGSSSARTLAGTGIPARRPGDGTGSP